MSGPHFACLASPKETTKVSFKTHAELCSEESAVKCFEELVSIGKKEGISHPAEVCDLAIKTTTRNYATWLSK